MIRKCVFIAVALVSAMSASIAEAHWDRHFHRYYSGWHHYDEVVFHRGYFRRGPPYGFRFGFATYRGDPFAKDDYYDGGSCYYLHHRDFCLTFRKPLGLPH